jgi:serine carboxypeptidase-like clade 2
LAPNPYSWNTIANIIFLDNPSGVGFSYSNDTSDYTVDDARSTSDAYTFLIKFFAKYPQFASNPLWLAGQGWAGHILPPLAQLVRTSTLNFQGVILGNPLINLQYNNLGEVDFAYYHSLIPTDLYNNIIATCNLLTPGNFSLVCHNYLVVLNELIINIDLFGVYLDVCENPVGPEPDKRSVSPRTPSASLPQPKDRYPSCIDNYLTAYLNLASVKAAIHADPSISWITCSYYTITYSLYDQLRDYLPVFTDLISNNVKVLVYSGDTDLYYPTIGTLYLVNSLQLTTTDPWRQWTDSRGQAGGFVQGYGPLTLVTVKGAAHEVPGTSPLKALDVFSRYLNNSL